jgi:hypothetical protein
MTVRELIGELLKIEDKSRLVVLQKDSEGNGYSPLRGCGECFFIPQTTYSGECPHPDDVESGEVDTSEAVLGVVLWPVN